MMLVVIGAMHKRRSPNRNSEFRGATKAEGVSMGGANNVEDPRLKSNLRLIAHNSRHKIADEYRRRLLTCGTVGACHHKRHW